MPINAKTRMEIAAKITAQNPNLTEVEEDVLELALRPAQQLPLVLRLHVLKVVQKDVNEYKISGLLEPGGQGGQLPPHLC